jgi:hypothetical protein
MILRFIGMPAFFGAIFLFLLGASPLLGAERPEAAAGGAAVSGAGPMMAKGGPPPHAPAHGYRAKHQYRYYPGCSVYYDTGRKIWFYIKAGDWTFGASLPTDLKAQLGESVSIGMDEEKPYIRNSEHAVQYPAEKYKKKK